MSSRRRARQYALQGLFYGDINELDVSAALAGLWSGLSEADALETERPPTSEEVAFCEHLVRGVNEHQAAIDGLIEQCSTNWRLPRMALVDRNILRIAAFELAHCEDIPVSVSMNEAIELAKRYGTAESRAFINGIVDQMGRMEAVGKKSSPDE